MKRTFQERGEKRDADRTRRSTAVGLAWSWAYDEANEADPVAQAVRVVLEEAKRLADNAVRSATLEIDNRWLLNAVNAYRAEHRRLRAGG